MIKSSLKKKDQEESIGNTLTPSLAVVYTINKRIVIGVGLRKGLFDDDNDDHIFSLIKTEDEQLV